MSSDVYFDFHTPDIYPLLEESWSKWYSKVVQNDIVNGKEVYFAERVSHLSNLVIETNIDAWELFQEEVNGKLIDRTLIAKVITEWKRLYSESQKPLEMVNDDYDISGRNKELRNDIMTSGQIKILLKKYKGYHLVLRTD